MNISFIVTLKNRIKFKYTDKNGTHELNLLGNNFKSLRSIIKPEDKWEFIIIDFCSTDANVEDFLDTNLNLPNMTYKLITLNEIFNKGKGFNTAIKYCSYDIIFCLDADMMIHTYDLFNDIQEYVVKQEKAFFPICWSYSNKEHTEGWKRDSGLGNVIYLKKDFNNYIEKTTWGKEDDMNYAYYVRLNKAVRKYYNDKFVHQWHPTAEWRK